MWHVGFRVTPDSRTLGNASDWSRPRPRSQWARASGKGVPSQKKCKMRALWGPQRSARGRGFLRTKLEERGSYPGIGEGIVRARELTQMRLFFISVSIPSFSTKHCLSTERKIKSQVCNSFWRNFEKFRESFKNPSFWSSQWSKNYYIL